MKVKLGGPDAASLKTDLLAVTVHEGEAEAAGALKPAADRDLRALLAKTGFDGKAGSVRAAPSPAAVAAGRVLFLGLGPRDRVDAREAARRSAGTLLGKMTEHGASTAVLVPPSDEVEVAAAAAEGLMLGDYSFERYKAVGNGKAAANGKTAGSRSVTISTSDPVRSGVKTELKVLEAIVRGAKLARDLGNEPSNELTPTQLAREAQRIAKGRTSEGLSCKILGPAEIKSLKMGAFLAVAQGSELEPRFIHLKYRPAAKTRKSRRVAVIGKGVTFDSGGISIKPSPGMQDMKMDMCGAAAVLGLFECLPALGIKHEVHGLVAACDNMPSGKAYKPGDVITSMAGRTIEIINTDAEGRLTLVDALTHAQSLRPDVMVDLATLTGAAAMALGAATAVMSPDTELQEAICASAAATGERAWPLPLFDDYRSALRSEVADIRNLGDKYAGATTAGLFLQAWVDDEIPWAHLDIAGSAWIDSEQPYCPVGATGTGVRTLAHWLRQLGD